MLKDATNQVREESDNLIAVDKQVEEAIDLLGEWIQETNDFKLAQELAEAMEKEMESQKRLEIIQGESAALKLAVEERRRIKAEADAKVAREKEDADYAKRIAEEEEKYYHDAKRQYEEDEKMCKDLQDEHNAPRYEEKEDDEKAPSRRCFDSDDDDYKADSKDDDAAFDFVPNQTFAGTATTSYLEHKEDGEPDFSAYQEEVPDTSGDRDLAISIARNEYRQDFQKLKQRQMLALYDSHQSSKDEKLICQLWDRANAEVDDVQGAVCLTLLLPNVKKLKVNIESDGITVRVVAWRQILERRLATTDNSQYVAEFHLDGRNIRITPKDISYDYKAETGILHVYIEEVCLDTGATAKAPATGPAKDNSTLLPSNASEKQKRNIKQTIANEIKDSFFRIFNNKNRK